MAKGEIDQVHQLMAEAIEAVQTRKLKPATVEETQQIHALKRPVAALTPDQTSHKSFDIVLIGGPGSGKGTQANLLMGQLNLQHVSTGNLFRENIEEKNRAGQIGQSLHRSR